MKRDTFGPAPLAERELSRHEAAYNRNPRAAVAKGGLAFINQHTASIPRCGICGHGT